MVVRDVLRRGKFTYGGINAGGKGRQNFSPMSPEPGQLKHELSDLQKYNDIGHGEEHEQQDLETDGSAMRDGTSEQTSDNTQYGMDAQEDSASDDSEAVEENLLPGDIPNPIDNSPYSQVRGAVPATDNTSLSINTPRMWSLSILFAILGSATNLFFSLRYPSVTITPVIALLLVHPLGLIWDRSLKRDEDYHETFENGSLQSRTRVHPLMTPHPPLRTTTSAESLRASAEQASRRSNRARLWLAQGRWNEKEHACVYISSNVSFGFAFATDVSFYLQRLSFTI